jgi:hypothetical protein
MNQQEEQIKELFQQLKRDDERRAPSFTSVWQTAMSRSNRAAGRWPVLRVALAAIVLLMLAGVWFVFSRQTAVEQVRQPPAPPEVRVPQVPHSDPPPKIVWSNKQPRKVVRHRRAPAPEPPLEVMISQWRSPTDFLLKIPAAQGVKEVPHLGVLRMQIKPLVIEQQNEMEEL